MCRNLNDRRRTQHYLRLVHLSQFKDSYTHQLSGGMRQRVALARALATEPDVLLMDEPFAALDAQTRDLLHDELERIWAETGRTIIFVTHNVREAVRLGDRVALMTFRPGRVKREYLIDLPRPRSSRRCNGGEKCPRDPRRVARRDQQVAGRAVRPERGFMKRFARQAIFYGVLIAIWVVLAELKIWPPYVFPTPERCGGVACGLVSPITVSGSRSP